MSHSRSAYKASGIPDRFQRCAHLEGPFKQFPGELKKQIATHDYNIFARTIWQDFPWKSQCLGKTYKGLRTKFVVKRGDKYYELRAGRFRYDLKDQVVVVELPDEDGKGVPRFVIVSLPRGRSDFFNDTIDGTTDWRGSAWNVWRPENQYDEYYNGIPETILRVAYVGPKVGKQETDFFVPISKAAPPPRPSIPSATAQDHTTLERQSAGPKVESETTKRRRSPCETNPHQLPEQKKARGEDTKHEASVPAESTSSAPIVPSDRAELQELHADGSASPADDQSTSSDEQTANQTTSDEVRLPASVDTRNTEEIHDSTLENAGSTLPLPPQDDPLHKSDDVTTDQPSVKLEVTGTDPLTQARPVRSTADNQSSAVQTGSQGGSTGWVSAPTLVPATEGPPSSSSTVTSDEFYQIALKELKPSAIADSITRDGSHDSSSMNSEHTSPLPPQNHTLPNTYGANTALPVIKQEVDCTNSTTPSQALHFERKSRSTNVHSLTKGRKPGSVPTSTKPHAAQGLVARKSAFTRNTSHRTGATDVIDLTDDADADVDDEHEHDYDMLQQVSSRQINVSFIDEHGQEQHTIPFEECNTAEDMFEEACTWDIADKETKMLEITIPGCKPARVRKNNEKHFAQKVFEPMKDVISGLAKGQSITLTVQKYM